MRPIQRVLDNEGAGTMAAGSARRPDVVAIIDHIAHRQRDCLFLSIAFCFGVVQLLFGAYAAASYIYFVM